MSLLPQFFGQLESVLVVARAQALTALLSGEMRDTAELGTLTKHATENYLPRPSRAHMFRRWAAAVTRVCSYIAIYFPQLLTQHGLRACHAQRAGPQFQVLA